MAGGEPSDAKEVSRSYEARVQSELAAYRTVENVHELPPIFHYWSETHIRPTFERHGFSDPIDFFRLYLQRLISATRRTDPDRVVRCVSIGAGNCDAEADIAARLLEAGDEGFRIECVDLNHDMLARGWETARRRGVDGHITFIEADFNRWRPIGKYDGVIANQALHHVLDLEHLLDGLQEALTTGGYVLVSDMVGCNGHMRSPEALEIVQRFWRELPEDYRYNQLLGRREPEYINHDCREGAGFEGIRSEDVVPLLRDRFEFELFIGFGNVIDVFVDRPFGHNFDPERAWDREFIDRVQEADVTGIASGHLSPTHMVAALRASPAASKLGDGAAGEAPPVVRRPGGGASAAEGSGDARVRFAALSPPAPELQLAEIGGRAEFEAALEAAGDRLRFEGALADCLAADGSRGVPGVCRACGFAGPLDVPPGSGAPPNFREALICPSCQLNNRQRLVAHLAVARPGSVYVQEQVTPFYAWARRHLNEVVGSEYLGVDRDPGTIVDGVRHEDVSGLSFPDGSFDVVASNDVLEHVPDVDRGLGELARVLRPGGLLVFTVPFHSNRDTSRSRAVVVGSEVRHVETAEYHGNPVDPGGGFLVFTDFGWDLLDRCRSAGFASAAALGVWSALYGHIGAGLQLAFRATR